MLDDQVIIFQEGSDWVVVIIKEAAGTSRHTFDLYAHAESYAAGQTMLGISVDHAPLTSLKDQPAHTRYYQTTLRSRISGPLGSGRR